jgi:beta-xylosidase
LLDARDTLTQCMQDNAFEFTVRMDLTGIKPGVHAGVAMFDNSATGLEIEQDGRERRLNFFHLQEHTAGPDFSQAVVELRVRVDGDRATYSYRLDDGNTCHEPGADTEIRFSWWKGSRPALFAYTTQPANPASETGGVDTGTVDFDWVHYRPLGPNPW